MYRDTPHDYGGKTYAKYDFVYLETRQYVRRCWNNVTEVNLGVLGTSVIYYGWKRNGKNPSVDADGRMGICPGLDGWFAQWMATLSDNSDR